MNKGEEFWTPWTSPSKCTTDTREFRIKYLVVEIVMVPEFGNYGPLIEAPRLKTLDIEYREPKNRFCKTENLRLPIV